MDRDESPRLPEQGPEDMGARLRAWLAEDVGSGDITTAALVAPDRQGSARILAREAGVLSGLDLVLPLIRLLDPEVRCTKQEGEGQRVESG